MPTTLGAIWGMNFVHMPELHARYGYALAIMVVTMTVTDVLFRRQKWL